MGRRARFAVFGAVIISLSAIVPATAAAEDIEYAFSFVYGNSTDRPIVGDWNGDGVDTPGVIRGNTWYLSNSYNGTVDISFTYGIAGDIAVVGDWNGDRVDTPGVVRGNMWYLSNTFGGSGDYVFSYGYYSDEPVVGDWDGNGTDTPGVVRFNAWWCSPCCQANCPTSLGKESGSVLMPYRYRWWISNDFQGTVTDWFDYGMDGGFIVGDWDADGVDTPGEYYNGTWRLSSADYSDAFVFTYGTAGDIPIVGRFGYNPGEFISDGPDTYGVWRAGVWYARTDYDATNEEPPYTAPGVPSYDEPVEDYSQEAFQTQVLPIWARYAPEIRLHPDEQYWPARVIAHFLRNAELKWSYTRSYEVTIPNAGFGELEPRRLGAASGPQAYARRGCSGARWFKAWELTRPYESGRHGCLGGQEGFVLNLRDSARPGEPTNLANVPVYYQFVSGRYIQYFFFYANDDAEPGNLFDHEGDWERIAIDLDTNNQPIRVAYYTHGCEPDIHDWHLVPRVDNTGTPTGTATHPLVWAAKGSHGSWYEVGDGSRDHCNSYREVGDDQLSNNGRRWRTWTHMVNANQAPWYGFGGAWGQRGSFSTSTGPLAPYPGKKLPPAGG
jgi:hypothetical protein